MKWLVVMIRSSLVRHRRQRASTRRLARSTKDPTNVRPATRMNWRCPASARCLHCSSRGRRTVARQAKPRLDLSVDVSARADALPDELDGALQRKQSHTKPAKDQTLVDNALSRSEHLPSASDRARRANGPGSTGPSRAIGRRTWTDRCSWAYRCNRPAAEGLHRLPSG